MSDQIELMKCRSGIQKEDKKETNKNNIINCHKVEFHSVNTCGAIGVGVGLMESRFVYNLGALLKTTGVGSEQYDFSG